MKKRTKKLFLFFTFALCLITAIVPIPAYAAGMTYDKDSRCISGTFDTSGSDGITRIEIYVPNAFQYQDDNILLNDISSGAIFHLNGDLVTNQGTDANTEVRYGGIVPINDYQMNCIIYYIVSASDVSWEFKMNMEDGLSECFVAQSKVPTNWETPYDAVITEPVTLIQYFIDSNTSTFTSMDDVNTLLNTQVQSDVVDDSTFDGEVIEEKKNDPVITLLVFLIGIVVVAIGITFYLLKKESAKKESIRSEKYVARENEKVKKKKNRENDELSELVSSYDDEYTDEDDFEDEEKTRAEAVAGAGRPRSGEPTEKSQPIQPRTPDAFPDISQNEGRARELNAPVPDTSYNQSGIPSQRQGQPMATVPTEPAPMPNKPQSSAQTYHPAPNNQIPSQNQYQNYDMAGQMDFGRSVQQQNTLPIGPQYQDTVTQQQFGYSQNLYSNPSAKRQRDSQYHQRVNQQVPSPKKVPAFARKQD